MVRTNSPIGHINFMIYFWFIFFLTGFFYSDMKAQNMYSSCSQKPCLLHETCTDSIRRRNSYSCCSLLGNGDKCKWKITEPLVSAPEIHQITFSFAFKSVDITQMFATGRKSFHLHLQWFCSWRLLSVSGAVFIILSKN